jgi:hypothetical protein
MRSRRRQFLLKSFKGKPIERRPECRLEDNIRIYIKELGVINY